MNHLICEHCDHVGLDVMPLAIAITTGNKNMPALYQKNLCEPCRIKVKLATEMIMFSSEKMNDTLEDFG